MLRADVIEPSVSGWSASPVGEEWCIAYCIFSLTPEQTRYCTTRKELLAVVRFTRHFRHYLLGRDFDLRTDHSSLQWLMNFKSSDGQLAR